MAEPTSNGVDVYAGPQEVSGYRVANRVWTDPFGSQRRHLQGGSPDRAFDESVDCESRPGLAAAIEKDVFKKRTACKEETEFTGGLRPRGTGSYLEALAHNVNPGLAFLGRMGQLQCRTWCPAG